MLDHGEDKLFWRDLRSCRAEPSAAPPRPSFSGWREPRSEAAARSDPLSPHCLCDVPRASKLNRVRSPIWSFVQRKTTDKHTEVAADIIYCRGLCAAKTESITHIKINLLSLWPLRREGGGGWGGGIHNFGSFFFLFHYHWVKLVDFSGFSALLVHTQGHWLKQTIWNELINEPQSWTTQDKYTELPKWQLHFVCVQLFHPLPPIDLALYWHTHAVGGVTNCTELVFWKKETLPRLKLSPTSVWNRRGKCFLPCKCTLGGFSSLFVAHRDTAQCNLLSFIIREGTFVVFWEYVGT